MCRPNCGLGRQVASTDIRPEHFHELANENVEYETSAETNEMGVDT